MPVLHEKAANRLGISGEPGPDLTSATVAALELVRQKARARGASAEELSLGLTLVLALARRENAARP